MILVFLGIVLQSKDRLETDVHPLSQMSEKPIQSSSEVTMDVDAPPMPQSSQSLEHSNKQQRPPTLWESSDDRPFKFSIFSWRQSNRLEKEITVESSKRRKKARKRAAKAAAKQALHPIPIIDENDDRVPHAAAGAVLRAADALLCRESVIDYVINATDLKDECDGLKKAYTKNCGGDEEEEAASAPQRRRLTKSSEEETNPIIKWQQWLHRKAYYIRRYWSRGSKPEIFLIEDEILDEWEEATYSVRRGWDLYAARSADFKDDKVVLSASRSQSRRTLTEADDFTRAEDRLDQKEMRAQMAVEGTDSEVEISPPPLVLPSSNKTTSANKEKTKLSNLALPTTKHHVSEKMLSETLLLQQDDRLMAHVKAATSNATNTAGEEAAKSSKAVSDTLEFVSNVLNDPSSIEARTCCTSILNVFHENCSVDEEEELSDSRLFIVVAVIAFCGMVKSLIRHFQIRWLPEAAGCILVGGKLFTMEPNCYCRAVTFSAHGYFFPCLKSYRDGPFRFFLITT